MFVLACVFVAQAQQPVSLPDSPDSTHKQQPTNPVPGESATSRFLGYATNKSVIFPDIATSPGPITPAGKFKLFVNQSISPPYVLAAASSSAFNQARNVPPGYGQGWSAYGSRFGATMARASSNSFFGTFLFASLLRQDPRFFPETNPKFWRTVAYSAQLIVITRTDAGGSAFNSSGVMGPLAAEGLANTYLPASEQTVGRTFARYATDLSWQFAGNMFKNYWPTLFRSMGLNRLKVIPDPGTPGERKRQRQAGNRSD